jgi:leucine dehydrogenase
MDAQIKFHKEFDGHEKVHRFFDEKTGLKGFIVIHSTKAGPAVGGTRYFPYKSEDEALDDALRLSKAMSYKCALADVSFGGGKCVLIAPDSFTPKSEDYLNAYAHELLKVKDIFFTGEDVGMTQNDIEALALVTPNIIGSKAKAGDPSPWAALSVYYAMRGALRFTDKTDSFEGKKVAIKGLGKVGMELARLLHEEGAELFLADTNTYCTEDALQKFERATIVPPEEIHKCEVDIYAPCALGREIANHTLNEIRARIICGSANNQLDTPKHGEMLFEKGVVYVPDYVANAGGLINVVAELDKMGYNKNTVLEKCKGIEETVFSILKESSDRSISPNQVSDERARAILL